MEHGGLHTSIALLGPQKLGRDVEGISEMLPTLHPQGGCVEIDQAPLETRTESDSYYGS